MAADPIAPGARFDRLATLVLGFALVVVALAVLAVVPEAAGSSTTAMLAVAVGGTLAAAVPVLALAGLIGGRPWGRPVAILGLWLLIASGAVQFAAALVAGGLTLPLLAIAAGFVLVTAPPPPMRALARNDRSVVIVAVGLAVASVAWWGLSLVLA